MCCRVDVLGLIDVSVGIEPIGNTAGNPARFIVETFSAGRGDLAVTVLNPRGVQEPASSSSQRHMIF